MAVVAKQMQRLMRRWQYSWCAGWAHELPCELPATSCDHGLPTIEPVYLAVTLSLKILVESLVHTGQVDNAADVIQVCLCYLRAVAYEPSLSGERAYMDMVKFVC